MTFAALMKVADERQSHKPKKTRRVCPSLVRTPAMVEREARYYAALKLVAQIDDDLARGIRHYRDRAGRLLTTLDEVTRAILSDDLSMIEDNPACAQRVTV